MFVQQDQGPLCLLHQRKYKRMTNLCSTKTRSLTERCWNRKPIKVSILISIKDFTLMASTVSWWLWTGETDEPTKVRSIKCNKVFLEADKVDNASTLPHWVWRNVMKFSSLKGYPAMITPSEHIRLNIYSKQKMKMTKSKKRRTISESIRHFITKDWNLLSFQISSLHLHGLGELWSKQNTGLYYIVQAYHKISVSHWIHAYLAPEIAHLHITLWYVYLSITRKLVVLNRFANHLLSKLKI